MFDMHTFNALVNRIVWGPYTLLLFIGAGVYFTVRMRFLQLTKFRLMIDETLLKFFQPKKNKTGVSPAEALSTALAGTMGTGNIAGVATAIMIGGPGAVFWMWVSAFFGMMTKYAEVFLAIKFRRKNAAGEWVGGPMYYMENGLNMRVMGAVFAVLGLTASFGIGNMTQIHSIAEAMRFSFQIPPLVSGAAVAVLIALVILGGAKRIYGVSKMVVPLMSVLYIAGALFIICNNFGSVPGALYDIVAYAFQPAPAVGGFMGASVSRAIKIGVERGVFSNEAGMGSASIAHAAAETDSPCRQGLWGIFEVFADTIIACTLTALVILVTASWHSGENGAALTVLAFQSEMGSFGGSFVSISVLFFAFASILGWSYYGEKCLEYLTGGRFSALYKGVFIGVICIGSVSRLELVWEISNTLNGLMALPNMIALILLSGLIIKTTNREMKRQ
ncbi:MAG: sodium:alanine symporter family protein [Clostridiales bacterium]|jgi:AGCS family alanine or glycine:cation symporter|nr:sodium:alanine symporter family protein [Clostridiales bacterium]